MTPVTVIVAQGNSLKNIKTFQRTNFGLDNYNYVICVSHNLDFSIIVRNLVQFTDNSVNLPYKWCYDEEISKLGAAIRGR